MHLKIMLSTGIMVDEKVCRVSAESDMGEVLLTQRNADLVAALVPCILTYVDQEDNEHCIAIDSGILVKRWQQVSVACNHAVPGDPGDLAVMIRDMQENHAERKTGRYCCAP